MLFVFEAFNMSSEAHLYINNITSLLGETGVLKNKNFFPIIVVDFQNGKMRPFYKKLSTYSVEYNEPVILTY